MKCCIVKAGKNRVTAAAPLPRAGAGDPAPAEIVLTDKQDDTLTVHGTKDDGSAVDISGVAVLSVSSSDPEVLSVDAPAGMTVAFHGLKAGTATLTLVAVWNDGSAGPFTITVPATLSVDPSNKVTGIGVTLGTPTIRG